MKRGEWIRTPGGGYGLYVGTSSAGVEWVAYDPASFREMCKGFDEEAQPRKIDRAPTIVLYIDATLR